MRVSHWTVCVLALAFPFPAVLAENCPLTTEEHHLTNDFSFTATAAAGAQGDVVGVDVSLAAPVSHGRLLSFIMIATYDPQVAELLGEPVYAEEFDEFAFLPSLIVWNPQIQDVATSNGRAVVAFWAHLRDGAQERLANEPLSLATFYFRLKGGAGETFGFEFTGSQIEWPWLKAFCESNQLTYSDTRQNFFAHSYVHQSASFTVLPGPPTHTSPPAVPPEAKIYDSTDIAQRAAILFSLTGGVVQPGDIGVPVEVYVTSNFEYVGYTLSLKFPPQYLTLARVVDHVRQGAHEVDNDAGTFWSVSSNAHRRMGAEGERVHLMTLYFDVKPAAVEKDRLSVTLEGVGTSPERQYINVVLIRGAADRLTSVYEAAPIRVADSLLAVQREPTRLGDANLDYELTIADAITLLRDLFQGTQDTVCDQAADANQDLSVDLTDAIAVLSHLYRGGPELAETPVYCQ